MFKLESYIAPILLSYVDKYIKNFRLEDSQVSLWGGDASFHNLDLRLEVLEQELQSPFSFISGHIRELLIHVPWTKLTSEPITITINTIECVLKLKDANDGAAADSSPTRDKQKKNTNKKQEVEAPPNYVQLLINKIVNNIRIYCNNLILKYLEEDIVLSMNIKHLKVEACNEKWEAAYTDPSGLQVTMRKVISVNDLTVCLDKRNSSGKIDVYQEPMLYRCSMTLHMLRTYSSTSSSKTSLTRLDIYCNNMEFSVTEQQVPMFYRLMVLITALQNKQLKSQIDILENMASNMENKDNDNNSLTWTGWAWSYVSSVLPTQWDENLDNQQLLTQSGHIVQIGFYVDNASLTFKISETSTDKSYYNQKKIRYFPLLTLQLQGIYSELVSVGRKWSNSTFGISEILLMPLGPCSCSHSESSNIQPYLTIGATTASHKTNSLFDADAIENSGQGQYRQYNTNWDFHMFTNTDAVLLERTPALACDFLYQMEPPDDASSDILSELGSNLEFSNMAEKAAIRVCCGSLKFRLCSGLFHRITTLQVAASVYDYPPYFVPKPNLHLSELLPPSEEDFDALNEFIPSRTINIMIYAPIVELQFMDHSHFVPKVGHLFKKAKKQEGGPGVQVEKLPRLTIECKSIGVVINGPMYINRLVHTTCQLPDPPEKMFDACFNKIEVNVIGLCSRLLLKENNQTIIIVPMNLNYSSKSILSPQYWTRPEVIHNEFIFEAENLTFNCTKAKLIVVSHLIDNVIKQNLDGLKHLKYSSLLYDACRDHSMPYLELYIEGFQFRKLSTNSTISLDLSLDSIKSFIFESNGNQDIQQVLCLSGPEAKTMHKTDPLPLFSVTLQYPLQPDQQPHASLVIFNLQEINVCVDPLVCKWFLYHPIEISSPKTTERTIFVKARSYSAETFSTLSEPQRRSTTKIESVHSQSSDREPQLIKHHLTKIDEEDQTVDLQEKIYNFLKNWHPVWKSMVLNGHIAKCVAYFPMASISAVGSQGVEQAIKEALDKKLVPNIMVISLPSAIIHSAQKQNIMKHLKTLPVQLPETIWNQNNSSFPWTISIKDLTCYALERGKEVSFVNKVGLSATVGLSTKSPGDDKTGASIDFSSKDLDSLGVYIHIDVTPVVISVSEIQMYLLASLVYGLTDFFASLTPQKTEITKLQIQQAPVTIESPSLSPTGKTFDNTSGTLPAHEFQAGAHQSTENVKLTAWVQWTMTKVSIEFVTQERDQPNSELKLVIDVEDIVSSLDYQSVYLKLKSKVGSIAVQHYKRSKSGVWERGTFLGIVIRLREDVIERKLEDGGFIGLTLTRASCLHTHNLWGHKKKEQNQEHSLSAATNRFLTEIVVTVQPIDFVLSPKILLGFYTLIQPFLRDLKSVGEVRQVVPAESWFTNQNLPLAYLECNEMRFIVPSDELNSCTWFDDVFILQIGKISLSPTVTNPILRKPLRPDIYRQAVQNRMLAVPGSELEDRQYQFDISNLTITTTTWRELEQVLGKDYKTMRIDNPALEWNNLKQGKMSILPSLNLKQVAEKIDICVVAAPMMLYKADVIVCSSAFEVNFVSDIVISLSLDQIRLYSAILNEIQFPIVDTRETKSVSISFPYSRFNTGSESIDLDISEFYKDSGIDTSEIRSVLSSKSKELETLSFKKSSKTSLPNMVPVEVLFTAGKISVCLYQSVSKDKSDEKRKNQSTDEDYEASEEEEDDSGSDVNRKSLRKNVPLIFFLLSQPNAYYSTQQFLTQAHISCFDFTIKLSDLKARSNAVPTIDDFAIDLIQTRSGHPDLSTGILPAFVTVKYVKEYGKNASYRLEVGRPTRLDCSITKLDHLNRLKTKLLENLVDSVQTDSLPERKTPFRLAKELLHGVESIEFKTNQLLVNLETETNTGACLSIGQIETKLSACDRPEKVTTFAKLSCVTLTIQHEAFRRLLLNPWSVSVEASAFLEPWQSDDTEPQVHVAVDSEPIVVDVSPEHVTALREVGRELLDFVRCLPKTIAADSTCRPAKQPIEMDQHYKDDLRAGAFQFIEATDSNGEELPLPYQVMFWNYKEMNAMAWRYPQPRALTKVRIFPVPLEITSSADVRVSCQLQYWSEIHTAYVNYASFSLSESEICYLTLPKMEPLRAVAYIWRVQLITYDASGKRSSLISPRALAACMRIDSYFSKAIVPNRTVSVRISNLEVALFSNFYADKPFVLPDGIGHFTCDWLLPECHCFGRVALERIKLHVASWNDSDVFVDFESVAKCSILDYSYLKERILFEQFHWKVEANLVRKLELNFVLKPIEISFSSTIAHTLAVNAELWSLNLVGRNKNSIVVFTKYVICNDTNINMRFGQVATEEDIFLKSRTFHMYCWRSTRAKKRLKVAFEEQEWVWSKPFRIDVDGTQVVAISSDTNLSVFVTIKSLTNTQKQIIVGGQFVISNMLLEHFEFKVIPHSKEEFEKPKVQVLAGKTITPSMFINSEQTYYFRLRFFGLDSAWTGDIPLKEHAKCAQPWLVKVPLQERGQFLSIWCRIVVQECENKEKRILATLWPLFMVKSHLPVVSKIHIETPTLNVHLDSIVKGKGELQQLYCPGTIDHSHQLTFKLNDGTSISDPYIPLNYSLVDQAKFFKKNEKENIDEIVESLRSFDKIKWPGFLGEELENIDWIVEEQPQTTIQVRYQNACPYSSALMVELLPWCLMVNTFGCPISIMVNGTELCRLPQYGIVAPPKLDATFHLGVDIGAGWSYSNALQLATSDWSQTFYMPKIAGVLLMDGTVKTAVKCCRNVAMVSITSSLHDEMRLLRVSSTHIFTNYLSSAVRVACLAVPDADQPYSMPRNVENLAFAAPPVGQRGHNAISIVRWCALDEIQFDASTTYVLYVSFSLNQKSGWSCPVRVDDSLMRKSFAIAGADRKSIPVVLTLHESKGATYLSLYHDTCPQTLIENRSDVNLYCAQAVADSSEVFRESVHFNWLCTVRKDTCVYYTMPFVAEKFPELPQTCFAERLVLSIAKGKKFEPIWSNAISITNDLETFVKIPNYGDVKVVVKVTAYTTLLSIESANQLEVNALDIRGRLMRFERESNMVLSNRSSRQSVIDVKKIYSIETTTTVSNAEMLNYMQMSLYKNLFTPSIPLNNTWQGVEITFYIKSFSIIFLDELEIDLERQGVACFTFDGVVIELKQSERLDVKLSIADLQFDNQMYAKGSFDFPVVLVSQETKLKPLQNVFQIPINDLIKKAKEDAFLYLKMIIESWTDPLRETKLTGVKEVTIRLSPLSVYIEDLYLNRLVEYFNSLLPSRILLDVDPETLLIKLLTIRIPEEIYWQSYVISRPLNIKTIAIEPLSVLLSVHSSLKMYIALDQSPLQFARFERRRVLTTPYRLGHAMTMHYLSGAIFGAGWVVSSLELLGSPSGLARAMGSGLRDFVRLPYRGLVQGPWAFLSGVTHGSASLMRHVTAGTLQSVTKLAASVARNLDRLTLDEEHVRRTEEQRRTRPQGVTQGLVQGLTGLGISLLGAVGGIAHHPLQSIMTEGASPRSLAAGVGLGLVGVLTKPLSGAAELLALTGQGLLQGAGWNPLPEPRVSLQDLGGAADWHSALKFEWKLFSGLSLHYRCVLFASEATLDQFNEMIGVILVLTRDALFIVDIEGDVVMRVIALGQLVVVAAGNDDPMLLALKVAQKVDGVGGEMVDDSPIEMDPAARARVVDYVKNTSNSLQLAGIDGHSESELDDGGEMICCYVNPQVRLSFNCWLAIAKQKSNNYMFPVL